jgi:hypothetical protein
VLPALKAEKNVSVQWFLAKEAYETQHLLKATYMGSCQPYVCGLQTRCSRRTVEDGLDIVVLL